MNGGNRNRLTCGNGQRFPFFFGTTVDTERLPTDFTECFVLRCTDGRLFRKKRTDRGPVWEPVNVTSGSPFILIDKCNDQIILMNFNSCLPGNGGGGSMPVRPINPTPGQPVQPVLPVSPTTTNGQGGIRPAAPGGGIVSPLTAALLAGQGGLPSATQTFVAGSNIPFSGQSQTGLQGQTVARLTSAGAVDTTGSVTPTSTGILTAAGSSGGDDLIYGTVDNGTIAVIQETGDSDGQSAGTNARGFAQAGSTIIGANNGATSTGNAEDQSHISATQHGAAAAGDAACGSLLHASSAGSTVNGRVRNFSQIRTGGAPVIRDLPSNTNFQIVMEGPGTVTNGPETVSFLQAGNNGCQERRVRIQNINTRDTDILGLFSSDFNFGPFTGEHAPGLGDGATAAGVAEDDAHILATADGAIAQGTAECGRVHMAAGQGSTVFGTSNTALAPRSMALGHRSFAYMPGSIALSSFDTPANVDMPDDCVGACQHITVMTKGSTTCIRDPPTGTQTAFILNTNFVLGDSPDNPLIVTPDGGQIDLSKVPFLHCPGTALVEVELVSPALISRNGQNLGPAICAKYVFCVSRTNLNGQASHDITGFTRTFATPATLDNFITVAAVNNDGLNAGFTLQIRDLVPLEIDGQPNPRFRFNAAGDPVNPIMGRLYCAYFTITFSASGFTELNCLDSQALLGSGADDDDNGRRNGKGTCRKCNRGNRKRKGGCFCDEKGMTPSTPDLTSIFRNTGHHTSLI